MPIFEYRCKKCETTFEALVPNEKYKAPCETCGSIQVEKQLSTFSTSVTESRPTPCSSGGCPSEGMAGTGCGGGCPYS